MELILVHRLQGSILVKQLQQQQAQDLVLVLEQQQQGLEILELQQQVNSYVFCFMTIFSSPEHKEGYMLQLISIRSLKLGHMGSKTRSIGQIEGKHC